MIVDQSAAQDADASVGEIDMPRGGVASRDGPALDREPLIRDAPSPPRIGYRPGLSGGSVGTGKLKIKALPASGQNRFLRVLYLFWGVAGAGKHATVGLEYSAAFVGTAVAGMAAAAAPVAPLVPLFFSLVEIVTAPLLFAQCLRRKRSAASTLLEAEGRMQKARACAAPPSHWTAPVGLGGGGYTQCRPDGAEIIAIDNAEPASAAQDSVVPSTGQEPGEIAAPQLGSDHAELEPCRVQIDFCRAKRKNQAARRGFIASAIDLARDMAVQAGQFGSTLAYTLKALGAPVAVVAEAAGTAMNAFGMAMGMGHIAASVYKLWHAYKDWRAARDYGAEQAQTGRQQAYLASGKPQSEEARNQRLTSVLATRIRGRALASNERLRKRAAQMLRWESVRGLYGAIGVVVGALGFTALLVGTFGLALPIAAGALGAAWMVFTAYKNYQSHRYEIEPQWHKFCLATALKEYPGKGAKETLSDYSLHELLDLAAWLREASEDNVDLDANPYFVAALAAIALVKTDAADADADGSLKAQRLQASAALRVSGMSKQTTQALKRGTVDQAYKAICEYLVADPASSTAQASNEKAGG